MTKDLTVSSSNYNLFITPLNSCLTILYRKKLRQFMVPWMKDNLRPEAEVSLCCVYVCCGSSLTGDLPSAVWPAGLAACVRVLWLLPDRRLAECGLAGRVGCMCTCVVAPP